jgi:hypothetical protein
MYLLVGSWRVICGISALDCELLDVASHEVTRCILRFTLSTMDHIGVVHRSNIVMMAVSFVLVEKSFVHVRCIRNLDTSMGKYLPG